jgi:ribosome-binding ATPase YchF (GTP1/OBG family)
MAHQIKTLNEELDRKMERLMEKQLKRKDKERTVAEPELERKLAEKYKELDAIRGQIKKIKAKEFSIQFAVDRVKELQAELKL